jgi:PST family polysaccharide transporter
MLGQMLGDESVGIYSAAVKISEVWYFIPMTIVASVFPSIIEAKKQNETLYYDRLQKLYDIMVLVALALAILMTFLSDWVVTLLFGKAYLEAGTVLSIHIWAGIFVFLGVASGKWFLIEGLQRFTFYRTLFGAVVNVGLNMLMIPKFGVTGAAYATVISYAIAAMFSDLLQKETRPMFRMKLRAFNILRILIAIRR